MPRTVSDAGPRITRRLASAPPAIDSSNGGGIAGWLRSFLGGETKTPELCPTILHITHYKAGSQWLHKILHAATPELVMAPKVEVAEFLAEPVEAGKVYPTLYITREEFDGLKLPRDWRRFVMIRDLRDTLVSFYFSLKVSHQVVIDYIHDIRGTLGAVSEEDGLIWLIEKNWLESSGRIQRSWLASGDPLIRYEELLERDLEILEPLLIDECRLPCDRAKFREIVIANRFENLTKGRTRGQEDRTQHERKGVAGDWQKHFTPRVKDAFKARYGELLIGTGYESSRDW
jgi:lipopolysaccharide transport system ATP-binding protein